MKKMKTQMGTSMIVAAVIGVFGAFVHVANQYTKMRKADPDEPFRWVDAFALFITALFSGLVFGLLTMLFGEVTDSPVSQIQLWLAVAIGSVAGWAGLIKVANKATDLLIFAFKK